MTTAEGLGVVDEEGTSAMTKRALFRGERLHMEMRTVRGRGCTIDPLLSSMRRREI
jgi:hypothetical protein